MTVDPELQPVLDLLDAVGPVDARALGPEGLRASMEGLAPLYGEPSHEVRSSDLVVPTRSGTVTVRRYDPLVGSTGAGLVWLHGGGWVIGSPESHDQACAALAAATGGTVWSVDYRLAPEHPYPAAVHDALDAFVAVCSGAAGPVVPGRIAVGGDSAGGHLATVVARNLVELGGPVPSAQVLVYPVTDLLGDRSTHRSRQDNAEGYLLSSDTMEFFVECFVPDRARRSEADASPLRAPDLSGLPPALVITAEFDPLRDEGEAYAAALAAAGVEVVAERYDGAIHLFWQLSTTTLSQRATAQIASFLAARTGAG